MNPRALTRRDLLAVAGAGGAGALAGCSALDGDGGGDGTAATMPLDEDREQELAEQFAPTLRFDANETWFPTDPRPYATDRDGERVVPGFDAVNGYLEAYEPDAPPAPTLFYNGRRYRDSPLEVIQFWWYSAFDQFTTNFHWHDWEALHVFVDAESDTAQLYVASAHSRSIPNNEFIDPEERPRILSELGSHSSALSLNEFPDSFQRLPLDDAAADVTNAALGLVERLSELPVAYGLPRDEEFRLPYVIPELDDAPVYEHPDLPAFEREHLVPADLTVRSYAELASPPSGLPERQSGLALGPDGDTDYDLVPTTEADDIDAFTGPQLSFEFDVPGFVEDAISGHITTAGTPWDQSRYRNPAEDISDPNHRATLAERYEAIGTGGPAARLVAAVRDVTPDGDAPDGEGVTTEEPTVESIALVESDPVAVPTFRGAVVADVPAGEHRLTVNGAGRAPHSERVEADGPTAAGADGTVAMVANEDARKLRIDTEGTDDDLRRAAVEDDFGGRIYDSRLDGRDAVYVHRDGAYTAEVRDADDEVGAFRVNPAPEGDDPVTVEQPRTGKASLAGFLGSLAGETKNAVAETADGDSDDSDDDDDRQGGGNRTTPSGAAGGLATALDAVRRSAVRALERAEQGDGQGADRQLQAVATRLERVGEALSAARGNVPGPTANAVDRRLAQLQRRTEQAIDAEKL
jgi:hypothetical protein